MPPDQLINILVTVTLIEKMLLIGLRVTFAEIINTAMSWPLIAAGCGGELSARSTPGHRSAHGVCCQPDGGRRFLVLAVCPGAPYGRPFTGIARADVPEAVGLMVVLARSLAVVSPLLLHVLLPWAAVIDPLMSALS
jgi:bile acid:Na+ symporter, BASS family